MVATTRPASSRPQGPGHGRRPYNLRGMDIGRCPQCSTPYSAADVAGLGILRARPAIEGGPRLEYRCAVCERVIVLVPHGEGRYAPPGEPPPPPVPEERRRPAWTRGPRPPAPEPPAPSPSPTVSAPPPPRRPAPEDRPGRADPVTPLDALEILGVTPTATREEVEKAFRARSLGCHPDKVAHLDAEFQALAHRKFQRLMEAYRLLGG